MVSYCHDRCGSITRKHRASDGLVLTTSPQGNVVWRWPWNDNALGEAPAQEDPDGNGTTFTFNLRFPGQYYDLETGLHYNYFRDYEPSTDRYIESDPIGLQGGIGTYGYVLARPLDMYDALGLQTAGAPPAPAPWWWEPAWPKFRWCVAFPNPVVIGILAAIMPNSTSACDEVNPPPENNCRDNGHNECDVLLKTDTETCNAITRSRGARAGARCHASATQRYAACLRGSSIPPLDTWNN